MIQYGKIAYIIIDGIDGYERSDNTIYNEENKIFPVGYIDVITDQYHDERNS
jgi:hypothetical protein